MGFAFWRLARYDSRDIVCLADRGTWKDLCTVWRCTKKQIHFHWLVGTCSIGLQTHVQKSTNWHAISGQHYTYRITEYHSNYVDDISGIECVICVSEKLYSCINLIILQHKPIKNEWDTNNRINITPFRFRFYEQKIRFID